MMKNKKLFYGVLVAIVLGIVGYGLLALRHSTIPPSTPSEFNLNLIFGYGSGTGNVLNTFKGTYTKDMVMDPSITVNLFLSKDELDRIYQKMIKINFFNYPEKFSVSVSPGETVGMVTPYSSYYFKTEYDSKTKELWWEDDITNKDEKAEKLRELIQYIVDIIKSKEVYKKLPESRGGYL